MERERHSNVEQAGLSDTISLSNMRPDNQLPYQSTPAIDPMMGLGAYGPLSGLNDISTVIGSLPYGPLDTDPNIFNQLSLLLENLPHSNAFNLQRGYVPTSEILPQVYVPTPSSPIRNRPTIPDDLESEGSSNEAVELNERNIEEQLINPQPCDVISQQDAGRSDYQHVEPQPIDVRPRQDVRQIDVQRIPPQHFDARPRQDGRSRPNKPQPSSARPHNAGSMSKMNTQQPDVRPRYPNVFEAFGGKMKYQEELNKIHPARQREGEQDEQAHTNRNPNRAQQNEGRSLETEVPYYNQVSSSNTQQRHNQTNERFSGTRIPIPTRQCEERSTATNVPHHILQGREGQSFARKTPPTHQEGESFARRIARSNLEGQSFERRTPRSIQQQYEERSCPQPYPTRTQQNEGWSMETEVPHYEQYQNERVSQQTRQPNTQSYEGRSMKTYVPHQETNPHTNAYQTEQRIEDIHRLLTERLREMEYRYQSLEQTVLHMQQQNSQRSDRSGRDNRSQRLSPDNGSNGQRYRRQRQEDSRREGNRERRTTNNQLQRRQLSKDEGNYDVEPLEYVIERQNQRHHPMRENNERRRNGRERRHRRQTSDNEES